MEDKIKLLEMQLKEYKELLRIADNIIEKSKCASPSYLGETAYNDLIKSYKSSKMDMLTK